MADKQIITKTFKGPITGNVYKRRIIPGSPGLVGAKVTAEAVNKEEDDDEEEKKVKIKKDKPENRIFKPGPAGTSPYRERRLTGGGIIRLKRKRG